MRRTPSRTDSSPGFSAPAIRLRPAAPTDLDAIADIWHAGWQDAHLGHVPDELVRHRTRADLVRLADQRVPHTIVAVDRDRIVGFAVIHADELEQLYVAAAVRRRGVATALVARAEATIAARFDTAWLAVVAGNTTARHFYLRQGWHDDGPFDNLAPTADGPLSVPARRYTTRVQVVTAGAAS